MVAGASNEQLVIVVVLPFHLISTVLTVTVTTFRACIVVVVIVVVGLFAALQAADYQSQELLHCRCSVPNVTVRGAHPGHPVCMYACMHACMSVCL